MIALDFTRDYAVSIVMTSGSVKGHANVVVSTPDGSVTGYISYAAWEAFVDAVHGFKYEMTGRAVKS